MISRPNPKHEVVITPYIAGQVPVTGLTNVWVTTELQRIAATMQQIALATPQVAYAAPTTPLEGMIRLAKGTWDPTSAGAPGTTGRWVRYSNSTWTAF